MKDPNHMSLKEWKKHVQETGFAGSTESLLLCLEDYLVMLSLENHEHKLQHKVSSQSHERRMALVKLWMAEHKLAFSRRDHVRH